MTVTDRPVRSSTSGMASTSASMAGSARVTSGIGGWLPDTVPGLGGLPGVEDLSAAGRVTSEVKGDEDGMGERPGGGGVPIVLADIGALGAHHQDRGDADRCFAGIPARCYAEQPLCATGDRGGGDVEVRWIVSLDADRCVVGEGRHCVGHC